MKILLQFQTTPDGGQINFTAQVIEPAQNALERELRKEVQALLNAHIPVIGKKLGAPAGKIINLPS